MLATVWQAIADPWQEPILRRAFAEVMLVGVAGGMLGCWVLFYNLSYSAESLAHSLLPGLVIAALSGVPLIIGGAVGMLVAALCIAVAARVPAIGRDTSVAVVVTTLLGLGVLLALSPDTPAGLQGLLFGDVLGVTDGDLLVSGVVLVAVVAALVVLNARLALVGFDRSGAPALGVSPAAVDGAVLVLLALVLVAAVQGLGNLLVVALLIAPPATAKLVAGRIPVMLAVAAAIAVGGGIAGLYLSYYAKIASGASIAAVLVAAYVLTGLLAWGINQRPRRSLAEGTS